MRGNSHVRFGERAGETGRPKGRHRAPVRLDRANATGLVAEGVDIKTAQALLGHSNAQLTLGLYAQAVVSLGAAAAETMAARFRLPGAEAPRDGRAMESTEEGSEGQGEGDATL